MTAVPPGTPKSPLDRIFGPHLYTLDEDNTPIGTYDTLGWAVWIGKRDNVLLEHRIERGASIVHVFTVYTGIDHRFGRDPVPIGPPQLWRTHVIGGSYDEHELFASTLDEARANHARVLDRLSASNGDGNVEA